MYSVLVDQSAVEGEHSVIASFLTYTVTVLIYT